MTTHAEPGAPPSHDDERGKGSRRVLRVGIALVLITILAVLLLWLRRRHDTRVVHDERVKGVEAGVGVIGVQVAVSSAAREVTLPAEVTAFNQATVYAKITGYVREMRVERGSHVKNGQILAILESPENERDVLAARSDAKTKERNAERMRALVGPGVVAQQDSENAERDARVARETLSRTLDINRYTVLRAPFDGIITARYADPGALLPVASVPLVDLAELDRVRIFVYVGQDVAPFVHDGDAVTLRRDEKANEEIPATVTHVTGALDPRTRTMQVEIDLDNRTWNLQPGTFVHSVLKLAVPPLPVIPNEALVVRDGHTMVAVLDDDHAHFVRVDLGVSDGRTTRVLQGLKGGETIGINVPVAVADGARVRVKPLKHADAGTDAGR